MRVLVVLVVGLTALLIPAGAGAADLRLQWPLRPPPPVLRTFDAPAPNWNTGHRGVDLGGVDGQPVYAAAPATVVFAGRLAGRFVISLGHPGGLRTTYEPVRALVRAGERVETGTPIGTLEAGHPGCAGSACLHWGAMWGPASAAEYVDPLGLLATTPVRLKPLQG